LPNTNKQAIGQKVTNLFKACSQTYLHTYR